MGWCHNRRLAQGLRIIGSASCLFAANPVSSLAELRDPPSQFWSNGKPGSVNGTVVRAHVRPTSRSVERQAERTRNGPPLAKGKPKSNFVLAVFGDAFGAQLARGLTDMYAGSPATSVDDLTSEETELTRVSVDAWTGMVEEAQTRNGRLDAALILLGGDDLQPLPNAHAAPEAPGSAAWRQLYGDRVEKLAATFRDKHVPLVWVGLPIVRDDIEANGFADINAIIRERAPKGGATFIDSWEAFADDSGQYSATGPDVNGQAAKLRRNDGWDFTRAGARKLASFVEASLKPARDRAASSSELASVPGANPVAFDQALTIDINAQIRREAGLPIGKAGSGSPSPTGLVAALKAGPVLSLNAPPVSTGGILAAPMLPNDFEAILTQSSLSRRGRADDFTWPPLN